MSVRLNVHHVSMFALSDGALLTRAGLPFGFTRPLPIGLYGDGGVELFQSMMLTLSQLVASSLPFSNLIA